MASTKREVAKSIKTLIVMLQSLKDQQVTITLRNDILVKGTIIKVDACMNIELKDAVVEVDKFYCTMQTSEQINKLCLSDEDGQKEDHNNGKDDCLEVRVNNDTQDDGSPRERVPILVDNNDEEEEVNDGQGVSTTHQCATVYNYLVVKGTRIRHIDLPSDRDLVDSTKSEIERIRSRRKQWSKRDIVPSTIL